MAKSRQFFLAVGSLRCWRSLGGFDGVIVAACDESSVISGVATTSRTLQSGRSSTSAALVSPAYSRSTVPIIPLSSAFGDAEGEVRSRRSHLRPLLPQASSACASARACLGSCDHRSRGKGCGKQFVIMNPR
jgi:hypothetical protein